MAFLEGWYVDPDCRGSGVGRALVEAVEAWARRRGLQELGSDALLQNEASQRAHKRLGFIEVERTVRYRKSLAGGRGARPAIDRAPKPLHIARAEKFFERLRLWGDSRDDIRAIIVAGSFAQGEARPESDVDVVLIANDPGVYVKDTTWVSTFGSVKALDRESYGRVTTVRVFYSDGLEVEFGMATADWASAPFDPGTEEVSRGGILVLLDRDGHATALGSAATRLT